MYETDWDNMLLFLWLGLIRVDAFILVLECHKPTELILSDDDQNKKFTVNKLQKINRHDFLKKFEGFYAVYTSYF